MAGKGAPEKVEMRRVVATAVRLARQSAGLDQDRVATRMRALGWPWHRQTVGSVEKAERRVAVEELLPLSLALECSMSDLIAPMDAWRRGKAVTVDLRSGVYVPADGVAQSVGDGEPMTYLRWVDDKPQWASRAAIDRACSRSDVRSPWRGGQRRLSGQTVMLDAKVVAETLDALHGAIDELEASAAAGLASGGPPAGDLGVRDAAEGSFSIVGKGNE